MGWNAPNDEWCVAKKGKKYMNLHIGQESLGGHYKINAKT